MRREIVFKGKDLETGEWVKGSLAVYPEDILPEKARIFDGKWWHDVDPETICQFTGLTDKDGNKIWENDIVKIPMFKPAYMAIGFIEGAFCLVDAEGEYVADIHYIHHAGVNNTEVKGTIFDHKYLMEG